MVVATNPKVIPGRPNQKVFIVPATIEREGLGRGAVHAADARTGPVGALPDAPTREPCSRWPGQPQPENFDPTRSGGAGGLGGFAAWSEFLPIKRGAIQHAGTWGELDARWAPIEGLAWPAHWQPKKGFRRARRRSLGQGCRVGPKMPTYALWLDLRCPADCDDELTAKKTLACF